jgi:hypothetical protein
MLHLVHQKSNFNRNHKWALNQDGSINYNYLDYEDHNGPICVDCKKFFCVVCDDIGELPCIIGSLEGSNLEWSPIGGELAMSIINRKGHSE